MSEKMRVLVAYDGSSSSEAALDDLRRAGLPSDVEAVVMTVVEQWIPVPTSYGGVDMHLSEGSPSPSEEAVLLSQAAAKHLAVDFPGWKIDSDARIGSPATVILEKADEFKPHLIVVGPSGHSTLGRWILGSVSQKVMTHSRYSVRLGRYNEERAGEPIRVAIGVDGSPGSALAIEAAVERNWPAGTQFRLINADFALPVSTSENLVGPLTEWIDEEREQVNQNLRRATEAILAKGFEVDSVKIQGDPKRILVEEVESWKADCIFVGAERLGLLDRILLGSVSSAVATRSNCSVEIVRPK